MKKNVETPILKEDEDLNIGDWVIEPSIGICQIQGIRSLKIGNQEDDFFVFYAANDTNVLVPRAQLVRRGVRRPMTLDKVKKLFAQLKQPTKPNRQEARMQYNVYREILLSGDPDRISKMLRDLHSLELNNDLKGKEREMKDQAFNFLRDEIAWVRNDDDKSKATEDINDALKQMYRKKVEKEQKEKKKK